MPRMPARRLTQVFALTAESRRRVLEEFKPCHPNVHAHRIFHCRGVEAGRPLPSQPRQVTITGFHSDDNIEYLAVSVDGKEQDADSMPYLLVLSLAGGKTLADCQQHLKTEGAYPRHEGFLLMVEPQYYHEEVEEF